MKKKIILILSFLAVLGISGIGYYHSSTATTNRVVHAIQHDDLQKVKKYLPEYSDHTKISDTAYRTYLASDPSAKQIRQMLNSNCKFVNHGWLRSKTWEPKKRTISISGLDDVEETSASLVIGKKTAQIRKSGHINLLPGNYKLTFKLNNSAYGTIKKKENINLTSDNQDIVFSPKSDFEKSNHLHKLLLATFSAFLVSWNKSIPTMDFSNLKYATSAEKEELTDTYTALKEILSSYENQFNKVTIDNSSVQIQTYTTEPTIQFTAYVDRKQNLKIDKSKVKGKVDDKELQRASTDGTVEVTMTYSSKAGHWKVSDADFDVDSQDPQEWDNKTSFTLPKENQDARWNKNQVSNI